MASGSQRSQLGGSWHVLDEDPYPSDGSGSDAGDEAPMPPAKNTKSPPARYATRSQSPQKPHIPPTSSPRRRITRREKAAQSTREASAELGPELIMPKITTPRKPPSKIVTRAEDSIWTPPSQQLKRASRKQNRDEDASREAAATAYRTLAASIWNSIVSPPLAFMTGLLSDTLFYLRPFLGMAFAMSIFAALIWIVASWIYARIWETTGLVSIASSAVSPITTVSCSLPLLSLAPWCHPAKGTKESHASFDNLVKLQDSFGKVLDIAQEGAALPMQITMAEIPLLELRDLIKFQSQLPSKPDLILLFENFVKLARTTSADLSTFNSHVGGAVDKIISMNRHTLRVLEVVQDQPHAGLLSYMGSLLPGASMGKLTSDDVITQYLKHAETVEVQTDALILEGEALQLSLEHMDVQLDDIRETANHDAASLATSREELFRQLWTYLGFNSRERARLDRNIAITQRLRGTRADAARVVKLTLHELRALKSGIVDLRARVVGPRWRDSMDRWEIEEHVRYVQDGLERLYRKRLDVNGRQRAGINGALSYARSVFGGSGRSDPLGRPAELPA